HRRRGSPMQPLIRIAFCTTLAAASVPVAAQTLTVGVSSAVTSIDPHYHNLAPNTSIAAQIYDRLVEFDVHQRPVPGLATSWTVIAPDTWEFALRDTTFQNGNRFVADDVVFTLDRVPKVPNSPSSFANYT